MIREYEDADAEEGSALIAEHSPWFSTAAGTRHRLASVPPRARRKIWVAEADGRIVGWGEAEFDWATEVEDAGGVWVIVHPDHRRRGLGSALFEQGAAHLRSHGARELRSWADTESAPFLERRGFVAGRVERLSALDPRNVDTSRLDETPSRRAGRLRSPSCSTGFPTCTRCTPRRQPTCPPTTRRRTCRSTSGWTRRSGVPTSTATSASSCSSTTGPAALSWVYADRSHGLADHDLTGTARAYRRRGLARLAKLDCRSPLRRGGHLPTS